MILSHLTLEYHCRTQCREQLSRVPPSNVPLIDVIIYETTTFTSDVIHICIVTTVSVLILCSLRPKWPQFIIYKNTYIRETSWNWLVELLETAKRIDSN